MTDPDLLRKGMRQLAPGALQEQPAPVFNDLQIQEHSARLGTTPERRRRRQGMRRRGTRVTGTDLDQGKVHRTLRGQSADHRRGQLSNFLTLTALWSQGKDVSVRNTQEALRSKGTSCPLTQVLPEEHARTQATLGGERKRAKQGQRANEGKMHGRH